MLGLGIGINRLRTAGGIPFKGDLDLNFYERSSASLLEKNGSNILILPSCGLIDGSNYLNRSVTSFMSEDSSGYIEARFYYNGSSTPIYLFFSGASNSSSRYFTMQIASGVPRLVVRDSTNFINTMALASALTIGWHTVRWESTGSIYKLYVDGVERTVVASNGTNDGKWINLVAGRTNISVGYIYSSSPLYSQTVYIDYVDYNGKAKWYFSGKGKYEYDVIGTNHLTWTGSAHIHYNSNVSRYYLDNGWYLYKKTGEVDEQVPISSDVTFLTSAGYSKPDYGSYSASTKCVNMANCYIDFSSTTNAVFDRSNETTNSTISRASTYYDASNPYRWHISEISDPRKYMEYLNVGYAGKLYGGITTYLSGGEYYIKMLRFILLYATDKTGEEQYKIMKYCGTNVFADI